MDFVVSVAAEVLFTVSVLPGFDALSLFRSSDGFQCCMFIEIIVRRAEGTLFLTCVFE